MPLTKPATCMVNTPRRERQHKENTQVHQGRYAPLLGLQIESGEVPETVGISRKRSAAQRRSEKSRANFHKITAGDVPDAVATEDKMLIWGIRKYLKTSRI